MKLRKILFVIGLCSVSVSAADFSGEVYRINTAARQVICRGADLSPIKTGATLYICDENNVQVATVRVDRYYTTVMETTLLTGDISKIQVKMPVFQNALQFTGKPAVTKVQFEKNYGSYAWKVRLKYASEGYTNFTETVLKFNKLVWVFAVGSSEPMLVDIEKIASISPLYRDGVYQITGVRTSTGRMVRLKECDINLDPASIPEASVQIDDFVKRNYTRSDLVEIILQEKIDGYVEEAPRSIEKKTILSESADSSLKGPSSKKVLTYDNFILAHLFLTQSVVDGGGAVFTHMFLPSLGASIGLGFCGTQWWDFLSRELSFLKPYAQSPKLFGGFTRVQIGPTFGLYDQLFLSAYPVFGFYKNKRTGEYGNIFDIGIGATYRAIKRVCLYASFEMYSFSFCVGAGLAF
jgi:hypothetical protein